LFAIALLCPISGAAAQANNSDLTLVPTNSPGSPTGADFVVGSWVVTSFAYTVRCGTNRSPCTLKISSGTLIKPVGSLTQLEYSFDGGAFLPVPTGETQLGLPIPANKSGTIVVRYQLGWAGNPFTPASTTAYSQPITLKLTQN